MLTWNDIQTAYQELRQPRRIIIVHEQSFSSFVRRIIRLYEDNGLHIFRYLFVGKWGLLIGDSEIYPSNNVPEGKMFIVSKEDLELDLTWKIREDYNTPSPFTNIRAFWAGP